ncbi:hypothetical protein EXIGLDRAFT_774189 [Exidia glandulosa HHB12029]|uniref:Uncharacterized protein n=1 Tax=Exidia glandulosa HHB12029 TaxID=1314781 RepID=A0A165EFZ0_EXIGL|nr:hypothetical protein EXIGLDRAFT_774189 [Exidia glandulosa HHB12029]
MTSPALSDSVRASLSKFIAGISTTAFDNAVRKIVQPPDGTDLHRYGFTSVTADIAAMFEADGVWRIVAKGLRGDERGIASLACVWLGFDTPTAPGKERFARVLFGPSPPGEPVAPATLPLGIASASALRYALNKSLYSPPDTRVFLIGEEGGDDTPECVKFCMAMSQLPLVGVTKYFLRVDRDGEIEEISKLKEGLKKIQ